MNLTALWLNGLLAMGQSGTPEMLPAVKPMAIPSAPKVGVVTRVEAQDPPLGGPLGPGSTDRLPPVTDGLAEKEFENEESEEEVLLLRRLLNRTALGQALNDNGVIFRGFTNGNFTASSKTGNNLPMAMNYLGNQFQLEQNTLIMEKAIDTSSDQFNWGARIYAILPGTDYRFTAMNNLADSQARMNDGLPNTYGVDAPEFFVQGYMPEFKTDVKLGRFFTIICNESIDPTANRLVSRALTFMNNPFTHVGALATTHLNDNWTAFNGITAGNDVFFGPASAPMYLGGLRWDSDSKDTAFAFNTTLGSAQFNQKLATANLYDVFELYVSHNITEKLNYTGDFMYSLQNNIAGTYVDRDGINPRDYNGNATWYGFINYLTYTFDDKLAGTARFEVFDDNKGVRTGYQGVYTTYTAGAVYKFTEGLWLRPEVRYDYNGTSQAYQGNNGLFTATADFILRW